MKFLEFNERQTKTRTGENISDVRKTVPKIWATPNDSTRDPVQMYELYESKRPADYKGPDHPMYLAPRTTALGSDKNEQWYIRQPIGEKKLGRMLKNMCEAAGLDAKKLSNHATRKRTVQKLRDEGIAPTDIMQITGHKNIQSILNYSTLSERKHQEMSHILANTRIKLPRIETFSSLSASTIQESSNIEPFSTDIPQLTVQQPPTHSDNMNNQQVEVSIRAETVSRALFGQHATINIQNFNVYMK